MQNMSVLVFLGYVDMHFAINLNWKSDEKAIFSLTANLLSLEWGNKQIMSFPLSYKAGSNKSR